MMWWSLRHPQSNPKTSDLLYLPLALKKKENQIYYICVEEERNKPKDKQLFNDLLLLLRLFLFLFFLFSWGAVILNVLGSKPWVRTAAMAPMRTTGAIVATVAISMAVLSYLFSSKKPNLGLLKRLFFRPKWPISINV